MDETYHKEKLKRIIIGAYQPINAILTMIREYTFTAAYDERTLINRIQAHNYNMMESIKTNFLSLLFAHAQHKHINLLIKELEAMFVSSEIFFNQDIKRSKFAKSFLDIVESDMDWIFDTFGK